MDNKGIKMIVCLFAFLYGIWVIFNSLEVFIRNVSIEFGSWNFF